MLDALAKTDSGIASAWLAFAGVVVGGVIVLFGQLLSAWIQGRSNRNNARRTFRIDAVTRCSAAAVELRLALGATADTASVPSPEQDLRIREAKSEFDVALPRVEDVEIRRLLRAWSVKAVEWANGELGRADEDAAWKGAMERLGEVERGLA